MTKQPSKYDWADTSNVLDDVPFNHEDAHQFNQLINGATKGGAEGGALSLLTAGTILQGRIVDVKKDYVVVDVGLKSEGLIPISEFTSDERAQFDLGEVKIGDSIEVYLDQTEGEDLQIVLSKEKARKFRAWEDLVNNCREGTIRKGTVLRKVKGGLMVDINGMEAFLPGSQIDYTSRKKNLDEFVGKEDLFKILKINIERKNVVVSRREVLEEKRASRKAELLENIQEGSIRRGKVKNIVDFGAFLDLDGIDGLLHITDMSWTRCKHPTDIIKLDQELDVMILNVDREKQRVALGLKQMQKNPYEVIAKQFPEGTKVKGKISCLVYYGAYLEFAPGVEGLIHISDMTWTNPPSEPSQLVNVGDEVEAVLLGVDVEQGKISLSMKHLQKNPWEDVERRYPVGSNAKVTIRKLTNYGAFVELEPGVDGLIHISDLSWTSKVNHPNDVLKVGDEVEAVTLSVDKESKKITLGVKQLSTNPWDSIAQMYPEKTTVSGKVTKIVAFGAFVKLDDSNIEALVHVNELSDNIFAKIEDVVHIGQPVHAKVMKLDPEHKKMSLSIKEYLIEQNKGKSHDTIVVPKSKKTKKKSSERKEEEEDEE